MKDRTNIERMTFAVLVEHACTQKRMRLKDAYAFVASALDLRGTAKHFVTEHAFTKYRENHRDEIAAHCAAELKVRADADALDNQSAFDDAMDGEEMIAAGRMSHDKPNDNKMTDRDQLTPKQRKALDTERNAGALAITRHKQGKAEDKERKKSFDRMNRRAAAGAISKEEYQRYLRLAAEDLKDESAGETAKDAAGDSSGE